MYVQNSTAHHYGVRCCCICSKNKKMFDIRKCLIARLFCFVFCFLLCIHTFATRNACTLHVICLIGSSLLCHGRE